LLVGLLLRIRNSALAIGCTVLIVAMAIFCGTATIVSVGFVLASGLFVAALLAIGKKRIVEEAEA
jgi:predicted exporter